MVAQGISGDGQTIVGFADGGGNDRTAWYWNEVEGTVELPKLAAFDQMEVYACSYDGSVIVGKCRDNDISINEKAVMWTSGGGTIDLLDGTGLNGIAVDVSDDGTVIVGRGMNTPPTTDGFIWRNGVVIPLEVPPNPFGADDHPCIPVCVSGDGSMVGGQYDKFVGVQTFPPVLWDGTDGSLVNVLTGVTTGAITGLNYDGTYGVGRDGNTLTVAVSRNSKTVLALGPGANKIIAWDGGSTVSSLSNDAFVGLVRFPLAAGVLGEGVRIAPTNSAQNAKMADNGLIYHATRTHLAANQAVRITMLVTSNY